MAGLEVTAKWEGDALRTVAVKGARQTWETTSKALHLGGFQHSSDLDDKTRLMRTWSLSDDLGGPLGSEGHEGEPP